MKFTSIILSVALIVLSKSVEATAPLCSAAQKELYYNEINYSATLQDLIDDASRSEKPVVYLPPGIYSLDPLNPIVLRPGVSLKGSSELPTILTTQDKSNTASIQVFNDNQAWTIQDLVFDNVNIDINENENEDETSVHGNLFFNGGRGSIMAKYGEKLYIDGNIFLRDQLHQGTDMIPSYNTTNTGVLFQTQKNSVVSNNIFGMDLRKIDNLEYVISKQLKRPMENLKFIHNCLDNHPLLDEQGYLASGLQLYGSNDITIKENILNATFPDTKYIAQDHGISVVGSNQTYIYQNFIAGWQIADFGGAVRFTSAVDGYVVSNYLANTGVMMYTAVHADYKQVSNMVVHNNFLYRFLGPNEAPVPEEQDGWLYEGITFFDFYTARLNYTIRPPIWNHTVPISPWGWHIVITDNKFGATEGLDPNVISLGNIDLSEAFVDRKNCYVTEPLTESNEVSLVWRQNFESRVFSKHGGKIPKKTKAKYTTNDLYDQVPAHLRNLPIPDFWKAFVLKNDTVPMIPPELPCFGSA